MHYSGIVYRPPFETRSLLLEVTVGCSHNACSFCTMYRDTAFRVQPIEQIEEDLKEARDFAPHTTRVFLENGDPFVLSFERLSEIAEKVHQYLPETETIAMYASINNVRNKTDEELKKLRALGINELNVGVESGLNDALRYMNKGYTAEEAIYELKRLKEAGMDYGANIIFGIAGEGRHYENAAATAELLNETKPYLIFTGTIHADPGCPLYEDMEKGAFIESTFEEYLDEEEELIKKLKLESCYYFGLHPSNVVQMQGNLAEDRSVMLQEIDRRRKMLGKRLKDRPMRYGEGAII